MAGLVLKSYEFRRERESTWLELDRLVTRVEKGGIRSLSAHDLARLPVLYRATLSGLSVARAISLDKNVVDYLTALTGRAYFCVYGTRRHLSDAVGTFFARRFPAAVRRFRWHLLVSALFLALGAVTAMVLVAEDSDRFYSFVGEGVAQRRGPASTTEDLRDTLYTRVDAADALATFATFLFRHNAEVGLLAFALGFAAGLPTFLLVFLNGMVLGSFGALFQGRGLGPEFWAWVLPHGITELFAIVLCGAGGLVLGQAVVFPGRHTRLQNLAIRGREAGVLMLGAVALLLVAGLIEGIFRQVVQDVTVRYAVATGTAALWLWYFTRAGRSPA
jgi:uncharacterized membrane protein SpoIIM required for sporulation